MTDALEQLLTGLEDILGAERKAIASLDLESLEFLTAEKTALTRALETALVQPELRDDPVRRRDTARAVASIRRLAVVNGILLQDAQNMVTRVRPEPPAAMTYDPRACSIRARAANDAQGLARTGADD